MKTFALLAIVSASDKKVPPRHPLQRLSRLNEFAEEWFVNIFVDFVNFCRFVKTKHNNALGAMTIWPPSKLRIGNPNSWETQPVFRDDMNYADITMKRTCPMEALSKIVNDAQVLSVISLTMIVSFVMTDSMLSVVSSKSQLDTPSGHSATLLTANSNQSDKKNALLSGWVCFKHCTGKTFKKAW